MHYGQVIEKLIEGLRNKNEDMFVYTKLIARGIVLTKIILKLI